MFLVITYDSNADKISISNNLFIKNSKTKISMSSSAITNDEAFWSMVDFRQKSDASLKIAYMHSMALIFCGKAKIYTSYMPDITETFKKIEEYIDRNREYSLYIDNILFYRALENKNKELDYFN